MDGEWQRLREVGSGGAWQRAWSAVRAAVTTTVVREEWATLEMASGNTLVVVKDGFTRQLAVSWI